MQPKYLAFLIMQRDLDNPKNIGLLEVEDTFKRIKAHKGVEGILIISKKGMNDFLFHGLKTMKRQQSHAIFFIIFFHETFQRTCVTLYSRRKLVFTTIVHNYTNYTTGFEFSVHVRCRRQYDIYTDTFQ